MQIYKYFAAGTSLLALATIVSFAAPEENPSLWKIQKTLAGNKYVDLTHAFEPDIPRWPGFPDETCKTIYWYDRRPGTIGSGFFSEVFTHVGQWGTHVDPPARVKKWEKDHGQISTGAFVALRTDWSKRWPDAAKMETKTPKARRIIPDGVYPF